RLAADAHGGVGEEASGRSRLWRRDGAERVDEAARDVRKRNGGWLAPLVKMRDCELPSDPAPTPPAAVRPRGCPGVGPPPHDETPSAAVSADDRSRAGPRAAGRRTTWRCGCPRSDRARGATGC